MDFMEETDNIKIDSETEKTETEKIKTRLQNIKKSCIYWLIWKYGSGKSVCLNKVSEQFTTAKRITFDAWQYPERKNLWDWFVLKIAEETDKRRFEKTINVIAWNYLKWDITFIKIIIYTVMILGVIFTLLSILFSKDTYIVAFLSLFVSAITVLVIFWKLDGVSRIDEYKEILKDSISKIKEDTIYIVLEDVDRSGTEWVYFLETLKNFLDKISKENLVKKKIICICPMDNKSLEEQWNSYIKCIEYYDFFDPTYNWEEFIKQCFVYFEEDNNKDTSWKFLEKLKTVFQSLKEYNNIREIKFIIRQINENYKSCLKKYENDNIDRKIYFAINLTWFARFIEQEFNPASYKIENTLGANIESLKDKIKHKKYIDSTLSTWFWYITSDLIFLLNTILFIFYDEIWTENNPLKIKLWDKIYFDWEKNIAEIPAYYLDD